jgi:hypothetical protein
MFKMTARSYVVYRDQYQGLCLHCGSECDNCEPHARKYCCEVCDYEQVYGVEELLMMGLIKVVDDNETEDEYE